MKNFIRKFVRICPKSGEFKGFREVKGLYKILFPIIGFFALLWIACRVINKPSRLSYPCVQTAMPFASGFIGYLLILAASAFAFFKTRKKVFLSPYIFMAFIMVSGFTGAYFVLETIDDDVPVLPTAQVTPNQPMGEAKGIFPGRVVWVHNPDATNENCKPNTNGDGWFLAKNNNQTVIDGMLTNAMKSITGKTSVADAWDAVFKFHNNVRGKGEVGYKSTEKIFIKLNMTSSWSGNFNSTTLAKAVNNYYGISETSPQVVLAVLRQLVTAVGIPQNMIYIGDPMKHIYKEWYDIWKAEFPNVHYLDNTGYTNLGREKVTSGTTAKIFYSDKGKYLRPEVWDPSRPGGTTPITDDAFYTIYDEMEYMINIPQLKGHKRAGITAFAKNHFGSHTRANASHLHNGLVAPIEMQNGVSRAGYGLYRVTVDLMGHKTLGAKNLIYIMDALWCADQEISYPKKFQIKPFNNDWTSSLFVSLDNVAIESVGYDFLHAEFTSKRPNVGDGANTYIQMEGSDDYLRQAADKANWPAGITYDPENDGTPLTSLGVHEHWNDDVNMQYTRNLGTGNGIELVKVSGTVDVEKIGLDIPTKFTLSQNYPNPFNPETVISYQLPVSSNVTLKVYDALGKEVAILVDEYKQAGTYNYQLSISNYSPRSTRVGAGQLTSGVYFYTLTAGNNSLTKKLLLMK